MRIPAAVVPALCCLAAALAACGGGDDSGSEPPDASKIATATLPAELPTPFAVGGGAAVLPGGANSYTIKSGDTFAAIADRFGVTLEELLAANPGVSPSGLHDGDVIRLPEQADPSAPAPTAAPTEEQPEPTSPPATVEPEPTEALPTSTPSSLGQTYTVQAGDIPVTIAEKFGITVEALLAANPGVTPTGLQVGQVLIIPAPATGN